RVNENISFRLAPGDRVALIGPNGAGKTTLVNVISGDIPPTSGTLHLEGDDITRLGIPARVQRGLVRTFQVTRLFATLTAADNVALAIMQRKGLTRRFFSAATNAPEVRT